jgi:hypothetical protein
VKLPSSGKVEIRVELILEDQKIYTVIGGDKENKLDMTTDAFTLVFRCMQIEADRLGGDCEVVFPEGKLMFKRKKEVE